MGCASKERGQERDEKTDVREGRRGKERESVLLHL